VFMFPGENENEAPSTNIYLLAELCPESLTEAGSEDQSLEEGELAPYGVKQILLPTGHPLTMFACYSCLFTAETRDHIARHIVMHKGNRESMTLKCKQSVISSNAKLFFFPTYRSSPYLFPPASSVLFPFIFPEFLPFLAIFRKPH
jgi:hypothetical protein